MRDCWMDSRDPVGWLVAKRGAQVVGLLASRVLFAGHPGDALSDALARGLLFNPEKVFLSQAWLVGSGPTLPEKGLMNYRPPNACGAMVAVSEGASGALRGSSCPLSFSSAWACSCSRTQA